MQRRWEKWRDHAFAKRASASAVETEEGVAVAEPDETEEGVAATEPNETEEEEEGVLLQTATAKQKKEGKLLGPGGQTDPLRRRRSMLGKNGSRHKEGPTCMCKQYQYFQRANGEAQWRS